MIFTSQEIVNYVMHTPCNTNPMILKELIDEANSIPTEINTSAGMDAVLVAANVGKAYKFTGTTDSNYTNGDIYVVEEVNE